MRDATQNIYDDASQPNYLLPTLRDGITMTQFIGAVRTRIEQRQKALWSHVIGAGFICEDIERIYPERNMRFFSLCYAGHSQQFSLTDLNLRELEELLKFLERTWPELAHLFTVSSFKLPIP